MGTFQDNAGRAWSIKIDAPTILAIRAEHDPKFLKPDAKGVDRTFNRLAADPVALCGVIHALTGRDRTSRGISDEVFYLEVLGSGETIAAAAAALREAILFFTHPRTRQVLALAAAKQDKLEEVAAARALAALSDPSLDEKLRARIEAEIDGVLERALTPPASATRLPDSAA